MIEIIIMLVLLLILAIGFSGFLIWLHYQLEQSKTCSDSTHCTKARKISSYVMIGAFCSVVLLMIILFIVSRL